MQTDHSSVDSFVLGHPNTVLRSPPLSHDPPYGMHPSAFSMMGRRPGLPDFRGSLDPILGSQSSLTSPGALHGSLTGGAGSAGWWMPPHPHAHGLTPEYFTSHIPGSWLSHEHDCALANHDRLEECLYPSARSRSNLMNGVNSSNVFGSGSGIFYPPPTSPQSMHGFVHQASPTTSSSKSGLSHWSSHGNHDGKGILDLGDGRDLDMIPHLSRKLSNCSEEGNDRDSEMRPSDIPLHHKERTKDAKNERTKATNNISENTDTRSGNRLQLEKNSENGTSNSQRQLDVPPVNSENSNFQNQQTSLSAKKNERRSSARTSEENHTSPISEPSKSLPTPPKLQKVKSGPPPRLQVPTSILNKTEGIVPTKPEPHVKAGKEISSLLREEMLKPTKKAVANSVKAKQEQPKEDTVVVSGEAQSKSKSALSEQKLASTSKGLPAVQRPTPGPTPKQPKIPSGKPPLIAHFRDVKYNEESSDDDSDSSNVSSGSESGSGSDDESEEGEEGENEEDSSGSDTDSDGSDEEEDGGEQHDDDDDEEDEDDVTMETQESNASLEEMSYSSSKRKMDQTDTGKE